MWQATSGRCPPHGHVATSDYAVLDMGRYVRVARARRAGYGARVMCDFTRSAGTRLPDRAWVRIVPSRADMRCHLAAQAIDHPQGPEALRFADVQTRVGGPNSAKRRCPRVTFGLGSVVGDEPAEFAALGVPFEGVDSVDVNVWVGESELSEFVSDGH
jgi:hypothetical protein